MAALLVVADGGNLGICAVSQGWQLLVRRIVLAASVGVPAEVCWAVDLWRGEMDRCSVCSTRSLGLR